MADYLTAAQVGRKTLEAHNGLRGYDIDGPQHALTMCLADLIEYADAEHCDLDAALSHAREVVSDCRD